MNLTKEELSRYGRQISLQSIGLEGQRRLKAGKVLVAGAGGLGCPALLYLAAAGVGHIGIVDFDRVEPGNLQRQVIFTEDDIGKFKAEVAAVRLTERNSLIAVQPIQAKITPEFALEVFSDYDLILDCTDNAETRYAINDACVALDKPFIYGGVHKFEGQLAVFNFKDAEGNAGPTYRCLFPSPDESPGCDAGVAPFLPGIIGTMQAAEAVKLLSRCGEVFGKLLTFNSLTMQFNTFDVSKKFGVRSNEFGVRSSEFGVTAT